MSINYEYDETSAGHADDIANKIDRSDAYIGKFVNAWAFDADSGAAGLHVDFKVPGDGDAGGFDIYTQTGDEKGNTPIERGLNMRNAIMGILGVRKLESVVGEIEVWEDGKRVKSEGDTFPDLCERKIGLILQKEKYTKQDQTDGTRMNIMAVFHPDSKLLISEIREGKKFDAEKGKFAKLMRGLKDKDSRVKRAAEPAQPGMGAPTGDY